MTTDNQPAHLVALEGLLNEARYCVGRYPDEATKERDIAALTAALESLRRDEGATLGEGRECAMCNGFGMIGGHSGQTPEQYEEHEWPCPACEHGQATCGYHSRNATPIAQRPPVDYDRELIARMLEMPIAYKREAIAEQIKLLRAADNAEGVHTAQRGAAGDDEPNKGMPRFFIEHGMVHDRKTGKHLVGCDYTGENPADLLTVLTELENDAFAWRMTAKAFSVPTPPPTGEAVAWSNKDKSRAFEWLRAVATADGAPEEAGIALDTWHALANHPAAQAEGRGFTTADINAEYTKGRNDGWDAARKPPLSYSNQPDNVGAWRLGEACRNAKPGGDLIDHGLSLLQELQAKGYGVVALTAPADVGGETK